MNRRKSFKSGDIIIFCDEEFEVICNYGISGKVKENCEDGCIIDNFYWVYGNNECVLRQ